VYPSKGVLSLSRPAMFFVKSGKLVFDQRLGHPRTVSLFWCLVLEGRLGNNTQEYSGGLLNEQSEFITRLYRDSNMQQDLVVLLVGDNLQWLRMGVRVRCRYPQEDFWRMAKVRTMLSWRPKQQKERRNNVKSETQERCRSCTGEWGATHRAGR
jgi:hypothetical protein